jgi:hypothetical protein
MADETETVEITWGRAFQVWWCFIWRVFLVLFLATGLAGFLDVAVQTGQTTLDHILAALLYLIATGVSLWVNVSIMRTALRQQYSDFEIVLVPRTRHDGPSLTDRLAGRIGAKE